MVGILSLIIGLIIIALVIGIVVFIVVYVRRRFVVNLPTPTQPITIDAYSRELSGSRTFTMGYQFGYYTNDPQNPDTVSEILYSVPVTVDGYTDPQLTVPVDTTNQANMRIIYQQIDDNDPQVVGRIFDNSTTRFFVGCPPGVYVC